MRNAIPLLLALVWTDALASHAEDSVGLLFLFGLYLTVWIAASVASSLIFAATAARFCHEERSPPRQSMLAMVQGTVAGVVPVCFAIYYGAESIVELNLLPNLPFIFLAWLWLLGICVLYARSDPGGGFAPIHDKTLLWAGTVPIAIFLVALFTVPYHREGWEACRDAVADSGDVRSWGPHGDRRIEQRGGTHETGSVKRVYLVVSHAKTSGEMWAICDVKSYLGYWFVLQGPTATMDPFDEENRKRQAEQERLRNASVHHNVDLAGEWTSDADATKCSKLDAWLSMKRGDVAPNREQEYLIAHCKGDHCDPWQTSGISVKNATGNTYYLGADAYALKSPTQMEYWNNQRSIASKTYTRCDQPREARQEPERMGEPNPRMAAAFGSTTAAPAVPGGAGMRAAGSDHSEHAENARPPAIAAAAPPADPLPGYKACLQMLARQGKSESEFPPAPEPGRFDLQDSGSMKFRMSSAKNAYECVARPATQTMWVVLSVKELPGR